MFINKNIFINILFFFSSFIIIDGFNLTEKNISIKNNNELEVKYYINKYDGLIKYKLNEKIIKFNKSIDLNRTSIFVKIFEIPDFLILNNKIIEDKIYIRNFIEYVIKFSILDWLNDKNNIYIIEYVTDNNFKEINYDIGFSFSEFSEYTKDLCLISVPDRIINLSKMINNHFLYFGSNVKKNIKNEKENNIRYLVNYGIAKFFGLEEFIFEEPPIFFSILSKNKIIDYPSTIDKLVVKYILRYDSNNNKENDKKDGNNKDNINITNDNIKDDKKEDNINKKDDNKKDNNKKEDNIKNDNIKDDKKEDNYNKNFIFNETIVRRINNKRYKITLNEIINLNIKLQEFLDGTEHIPIDVKEKILLTT